MFYDTSSHFFDILAHLNLGWPVISIKHEWLFRSPKDGNSIQSCQNTTHSELSPAFPKPKLNAWLQIPFCFRSTLSCRNKNNVRLDDNINNKYWTCLRDDGYDPHNYYGLTVIPWCCTRQHIGISSIIGCANQTVRRKQVYLEPLQLAALSITVEMEVKKVACPCLRACIHAEQQYSSSVLLNLGA